MMDGGGRPQSPAYDSCVEICGTEWLVTRSLGLLKRLEQRFGALTPFAARVERFAATQAELALVYHELIRGGDPGSMPQLHQIESWIYGRGTHACCRDLVRLLYELTVGADRLRELDDKKRIDAEEAAERDGRPFPQPAAATA